MCSFYPLWLIGNSLSVLSSLAVHWTELSIGISHLFFKIRLHVYQSQLHVLKFRGNQDFHTILWWKNFKQFFTLTDLEQSYTYIGLLQHNIHVVQYFYSWLRISIFVHSIASDLPLHFTSKFHFVNIILYQLFFLIQMSSIELIFIIFQTSSLPDRKRKQKSV